MDEKSQRRQIRQRSRDPLDRRFDNWIETGRQLVDGVAGNRPGQRRTGAVDRRASSSLESMGRWVGQKIDWFLEEEDWTGPDQVEEPIPLAGGKRPLGAISKRVQSVSSPQVNSNQSLNDDEDWPDEDTFKLDRWQRVADDGMDRKVRQDRTLKRERSDIRPLPRSSRRRY